MYLQADIYVSLEKSVKNNLKLSKIDLAAHFQRKLKNTI